LKLIIDNFVGSLQLSVGNWRKIVTSCTFLRFLRTTPLKKLKVCIAHVSSMQC